MQLIVNNQALEVASDVTVEALKLQIENTLFTPASMVVLSKGGLAMTSGSISAFGVEENDVIEMGVAGDAGMRAKWRKKRMRRLRRKRRKMRQRAR